jgi:hypothetical protein
MIVTAEAVLSLSCGRKSRNLEDFLQKNISRQRALQGVGKILFFIDEKTSEYTYYFKRGGGGRTSA